ncbi:Serine phosphatase RsbU, regulator of sigma subunit [Gloeomargarita lithophora Alchichica-D10]|uniref:Serine phosphatase RsbU, regulator of sigma subunit n=1 Tax=Gloeomargarita lithophora Alchichica-D10 TaxID=1188229 RepID=A0A1J0AFH5_9CYAN|nr:PP2C family protein-serine/threonine phosphatase [Gloeomargarita lithophora]APB34651.1 Serine phosphatase RsbU, regulator of sigma subunit [Gloeomargarita lithophora Alchichica-D10]
MVDRPATPTLEGVLTLKELVARSQREHRKVQELLSYLGSALRNLHNLNQFLQLIPVIATRVCEGEGAALLLWQAKEGCLTLAQFHSHREEWNVTLRPLLGDYLSRLPLEMAHPLFARLEVELPQVLQVTAVGTAVIVAGQEQGWLVVFSDRSGLVTHDARKQLLNLVADQTAVAMEQEQLRLALRERERLDRELKLGAEIQKHLLPETHPRIPGLQLESRYFTAQWVGGDYYDFIPVAGGERWAIVIGDVMGKGVPAGLIMTMTRGMLRSEVLRGHTPAEILSHLNQVMYEDLTNSHRFVTLFYSEYDPHSRQLTFCNAAHNPPLLWRSQVQEIVQLDTPGMLIGLEPQGQYENGAISLTAGDVLVYYTDGFTDAANFQGARFETAGLLQAVQDACALHTTAQDILEYLFVQVKAFVGPRGSAGDDITLIVVRVTD